MCHSSKPRKGVGFPSNVATSKAALGNACCSHLYRRAAVRMATQGRQRLPLGPY